MATKIYEDGNAPATKIQFLEDDTQTAADGGILTDEEMEASKLVTATFHAAEFQVPNEFIATSKDTNGNMITEPVWDRNDPKFRECDMITTSVPNPASGSPTVTTQFVTPFHIKRWPERWARYKSGKASQLEGTPLDQLTTIPKASIPKLNEVGIFTIEQMAKVGDAGSLILSGNTYQTAARKFLAAQTGSDTEELKSQLEEMKAQLAELLAQKGKAAK